MDACPFFLFHNFNVFLLQKSGEFKQERFSNLNIGVQLEGFASDCVADEYFVEAWILKQDCFDLVVQFGIAGVVF